VWTYRSRELFCEAQGVEWERECLDRVACVERGRAAGEMVRACWKFREMSWACVLWVVFAEVT